jgi:hypothetical protein
MRLFNAVPKLSPSEAMCSWFTGVIVGMMVGIPRKRYGGVGYSAPLLASWQEERMLRLVGLTLRSEARELTP